MNDMSLVNLLAFVQVAVVFNFGLFFLRRRNTFSDVKMEFLDYLNAYKEGYSQRAKNIIEEQNENDSYATILEKENVNTYYNRIEYLTKEEDQDYLVLPCVGLFSGVYSLLFLLIVGLEGWMFEDKTYNMLLLMAQVVLFMNLYSCFKLRKDGNEMMVRRQIIKHVALFFILGLLAILLSCFDCLFQVINCPDTVLAISTILVVYFPALLLVYVTLKSISSFLYNQLMCNYHIWKYRRLLAKEKVTGGEMEC